MFDSLKSPILTRLLLVFFLASLPCCATGDDLKPIGEAANGSSGGDASGKSGQLSTKLSAQVNQAGDNSTEASGWEVSPQRNTTTTAAGWTNTAVSISVAGGAAALRQAVDQDPIIRSIQEAIAQYSEELAALKGKDRVPVETALREAKAALVTRVREIEAAAAKSTPSFTMGDVHLTVTNTSPTGSPPVPMTPETEKTGIEEITKTIATGTGQSVSSSTTSKPVEKDPTSDQ